jgi:uncharacterized protein YbdZ (MbtH family)
MKFVIVKERTTGEYSYWPEQKKELPTDYEVVDPMVTKDTEQDALDYIHQQLEKEKQQQLEKKRSDETASPQKED